MPDVQFLAHPVQCRWKPACKNQHARSIQLFQTDSGTHQTTAVEQIYKSAAVFRADLRRYEFVMSQTQCPSSTSQRILISPMLLRSHGASSHFRNLQATRHVHCHSRVDASQIHNNTVMSHRLQTPPQVLLPPGEIL